MSVVVLQVLLWSSFLLLFYIYLGYPILIWSWARIRPRPIMRAPTNVSASVIIAAYNEGVRLPAKIQSLLGADERGQVREILVASDGSTDDTADVIERVGSPRVRLLHYPTRRGKPAVLNDAVAESSGEILVFTDARQALAPHAITALLDCFSDREIGVVSGELVFRPESQHTAAGQGMGVYWSYEKFIRRQEASVHSVPGATGALYAVRRECFVPMPRNALLDDVVVPMQAVIAGTRCCFEPGAVAFDSASETAQQESARKRRTLAGCLQLMGLFPGWLLPWRNPIWLQYISHKLLRLASPFLLLIVLGATVLLWGTAPYGFLLGLQCLFYAAATVGWVLDRMGGRSFGFGIPWMFVSLNVDTLRAVVGGLMRRYQVTWERPRPAEDPAGH